MIPAPRTIVLRAGFIRSSSRLVASFLYLAIAIVVGGGAPAAAAQEVPDGFQDEWSSIEASFASLLDEEGVVGGSLAFVQGGRTLALATHGMADRDAGRAVDARTIYHWASITKTLTSIAILQLRDRGRLSLDDPIVDYVPELKGVHNPFGSMDEVTIRHLLSHSAGFRGSTWPWGGGRDWHPHEPTEWSQLVAMMPYTEIVFPPGSKWQYSNPGIVFLGRVIELLSGEDFEVYMEKNVLRPLGMRSAYYDHTPYHLLRHRSNNYYGNGEERTANGPDFDTGITVSNGGLNGSVEDLANYLAFLLDDAPTSEASGVLARESLVEMWQPQVAIGEGEGIRQDMGLGYFLLHRSGRRFVGHTGSQMGFRTAFYIRPEAGVGMIVALNTAAGSGSDHPDTGRILGTIRNAVMDRLVPLFEVDTTR